jgi:four helix bundle protein
MTNQNWLEYKIQIRDRLKIFALKILQLSEMLPKTERGRILNNQITRSGTSTYANYRAALRGRSRAEFFSKLSIVVEEADETEMWLDLIIDSGVLTGTFISELHAESIELLKILASMRKRVSK